MVTIDEAHEILEALAEEVPQKLYRDLNGGIILLPDVRMSEENLYTLGEYVVCGSMGRYIAIYYGSFEYVFGENATKEKITKELRSTLFHEFTHHIESLAGDDSLGKEDELRLKAYRRKNHRIQWPRPV